MKTVSAASYEGGYRIRLRFGGDEAHVVDLEPILRRYPAAASLLGPAKFSQFFLDEWPTLAWPCGFDVSPEMLYELATGQTPAWAEQHAVELS